MSRRNCQQQSNLANPKSIHNFIFIVAPIAAGRIFGLTLGAASWQAEFVQEVKAVGFLYA